MRNSDKSFRLLWEIYNSMPYVEPQDPNKEEKLTAKHIVRNAACHVGLLQGGSERWPSVAK